MLLFSLERRTFDKILYGLKCVRVCTREGTGEKVIKLVQRRVKVMSVFACVYESVFFFLFFAKLDDTIF